MGKPANYIVVSNTRHGQPCVIRDIGPWDVHFTVTNDVQNVVRRLYRDGDLIAGQRLFYFDSEGERDEILHSEGEFTGFAPGVIRRRTT